MDSNLMSSPRNRHSRKQRKRIAFLVDLKVSNRMISLFLRNSMHDSGVFFSRKVVFDGPFFFLKVSTLYGCYVCLLNFAIGKYVADTFIRRLPFRKQNNARSIFIETVMQTDVWHFSITLF